MPLIITSKRLMAKLNNISLDLSATTDESTGKTTHTATVRGYENIAATADTPEHAIRAAKEAAKVAVLKDGSAALHTKAI